MFRKTIAFSASKMCTIHPNLVPKYYQKLFNKLWQYKDLLMLIASEPMFLDDSARADEMTMIKAIASNQDVLICYYGESESTAEILGVVSFHDVILGREAEISGWINPRFRNGSFSVQKAIRKFLSEDILDYAWNQLGLLKIKAEIAVENRSALRFAQNMGMVYVGLSQLSALIFGNLHDMVILEALNPAIGQQLAVGQELRNSTEMPIEPGIEQIYERSEEQLEPSPIQYDPSSVDDSSGFDLPDCTTASETALESDSALATRTRSGGDAPKRRARRNKRESSI